MASLDAFYIAFKESADLVLTRSERWVFQILQVVGEDQIILAFFQRSLSDVQQPDLIFGAPFLESFRDVCGNRYGGAAHLRCQPKEFILRNGLVALYRFNTN